MKRLLIGLIRGYQKVISPCFPSRCRFTPSCSQYAAEAIAKFGVFKGCFLGLKRILRCNWFSKGGFDPVPDNWKGEMKWVL